MAVYVFYIAITLCIISGVAAVSLWYYFRIPILRRELQELSAIHLRDENSQELTSHQLTHSGKLFNETDDSKYDGISSEMEKQETSPASNFAEALFDQTDVLDVQENQIEQNADVTDLLENGSEQEIASQYNSEDLTKASEESSQCASDETDIMSDSVEESIPNQADGLPDAVKNDESIASDQTDVLSEPSQYNNQPSEPLNNVEDSLDEETNILDVWDNQADQMSADVTDLLEGQEDCQTISMPEDKEYNAQYDETNVSPENAHDSEETDVLFDDTSIYNGETDILSEGNQYANAGQSDSFIPEDDSDPDITDILFAENNEDNPLYNTQEDNSNPTNVKSTSQNNLDPSYTEEASSENVEPNDPQTDVLWENKKGADSKDDNDTTNILDDFDIGNFLNNVKTGENIDETTDVLE